MKGKIITNITKNETIFIDGATGAKLTKQEFAQKHKRINLGQNRIGLSQAEEKGGTEENLNS